MPGVAPAKSRRGRAVAARAMRPAVGLGRTAGLAAFAATAATTAAAFAAAATAATAAALAAATGGMGGRCIEGNPVTREIYVKRHECRDQRDRAAARK